MKRLSALLSPEMTNLIHRVASSDPETQTWTCPHCGVVPAKELHLAPGYYIRRSCPCEVSQREQQAVKAALGASLLEQRYTWIGREWADLALLQKSFATFERTPQPVAVETAQAFAHDPQGALVLYGPYGVGKTHLLAAIANARCAEGKSCLYVSAVTLFEVLQERIQQNRDYRDLLKRAMHTPLLLIDDLDKPKPSEFRESIFYHLIDKRSLAGLPLAISCNGTPADLDRWIGGAARSRLMMGLRPVEMRGTDYRLQQGTREGGESMSK